MGSRTCPQAQPTCQLCGSGQAPSHSRHDRCSTCSSQSNPHRRRRRSRYTRARRRRLATPSDHTTTPPSVKIYSRQLEGIHNRPKLIVSGGLTAGYSRMTGTSATVASEAEPGDLDVFLACRGVRYGAVRTRAPRCRAAKKHQWTCAARVQTKHWCGFVPECCARVPDVSRR